MFPKKALRSIARAFQIEAKAIECCLGVRSKKMHGQFKTCGQIDVFIALVMQVIFFGFGVNYHLHRSVLR